MSRTLEAIETEGLEAVSATAELSTLEILTTNEQNTIANLTSTSKVARWRKFIKIMSFMIFVHEQLWDVLRLDLENRIASSRIHTRPWYREKALAFRYGQDLIPETDVYTDEGLTVPEIEASKIIKHAAIVRVVVNGYGTLRAKVAKEENGEPVPLNTTEGTALAYYMNEVADAGTVITITSLPADDLKLELVVYYDPLILDNEGKRLDGTNNTPVVESCISFLRNIDFNGEFIKTELKDYLKQVEGVKIPVVKNAWSRYGTYNYDIDNVPNVGVVDEIRVTESGYMKLDLDNTIISYVPKND